MFKGKRLAFCFAAGTALCASTMAAKADSWGSNNNASCPVSYSQLKSALTQSDTADVSGFNNHFWGVVVDRSGVVCAVAFSGADTGSQWLGSRQIAEAKAFTANAFSLDYHAPSPAGAPPNGTTALSTAQLYQFVQPSNANVANPLFGLDGGNVQDATIVYLGSYNNFGTPKDPMVGLRLGGTITFGGGLALYKGNKVVGGLGLSGDTACADHSTAWRTRIALNAAPPQPVDALTFADNKKMTNGHPHCPNDTATQGTTTPPAS